MTDTQLTQEQYELFKNAEERMKQKRLLYIHFFVFVLGTIFFWVANKLLGYGADYKWWYWAALISTDLWEKNGKKNSAKSSSLLNKKRL